MPTRGALADPRRSVTGRLSARLTTSRRNLWGIAIGCLQRSRRDGMSDEPRDRPVGPQSPGVRLATAFRSPAPYRRRMRPPAEPSRSWLGPPSTVFALFDHRLRRRGGRWPRAGHGHELHRTCRGACSRTCRSRSRPSSMTGRGPSSWAASGAGPAGRSFEDIDAAAGCDHEHRGPDLLGERGL